MQVPSLGGEDPLEEGMATHSSSLAWRIPCTEEPGRQTMVHRVAESDTTEAAWHAHMQARISLCRRTTECFSTHLLKVILVVSNF